MANRIRILSEELANQIAAGEVVERPASVVKELVENALDAGATEVLVDIQGGGRSLVRVVDNGSGMSRDDALLALERHATSKIAVTEDLFAIRTLGFRGEALAAIAGVSRLELVTRQPEAERGSRVFAQGGLVRQVEEVGAPVGTSIQVRDLFFNTPARLKFLKSAAIESGHIIDIVTRLAMSHEELSLKLLRGPETLVKADADRRGRDRLAQLLGQETLQHLFSFRAERAGLRVWGYLSGPELNRSGWSGLYAFVNRRFMRDRLVTRAVGEAYRGSIPKGRYPVVILFLELEPQEVDVNVHPGKIEVRFARPRSVSELIQDAIRGTLLQTPWKRVAAGLGVPFQKLRSPLLELGLPSRGPLEVPDELEAPLDPPLPDPVASNELETPRHLEQAELLRQDLVTERGGRPAAASRFRLAEPDPEEEAARLASLEDFLPPPELLGRSQREDRALEAVPPVGLRGGTAPVQPDPALRLAAEDAGPAGGDGSGTVPEAGLRPRPPRSVPAPAVLQTSEIVAARDDFCGSSTRAAGARGPSDREEGESACRGRRGGGSASPASFAGTARAETVAASVATPRPTGPNEPLVREVPGILPGLETRNFSHMRIIGQYANCFILCQDGDELVILDQHAAHERVTFEQLKKGYEGIGARSQLLLHPRVVELPRREAELLTDQLEALRALGLEVEPFGGSTFAVKALPVPLKEEEPGALLLDLASDLTSDLARQPLHERIYLMLATMACHGSIRANRRMQPVELEALLRLLDGTDFSYACPHGRPLIARSSRREVERLFKRT